MEVTTRKKIKKKSSKKNYDKSRGKKKFIMFYERIKKYDKKL